MLYCGATDSVLTILSYSLAYHNIFYYSVVYYIEWDDTLNWNNKPR